MTAPATGHILETALYVDNLDAAEEFYGGLLGFEPIIRVGNRHVFYRVGMSVLLVFNPSETERASAGARPVPPHGAHGPGHVCFAASATEIVDWRQKFVENHILIEAEFSWPNGAKSLYIRDPAGNSVEFAEPRLWHSSD